MNALLALVFFLFLTQSADADTNLKTSGAWDIASNWTNGVPTSSASAYVDSGLTVSVPAGISGSASHLIVGYSGTGTLIINGGNITDAIAYLSEKVGSNGTVIVTSGTWTNSTVLFVGCGSAVGTLTIAGGCAVNTQVQLGTDASSNGTVSVTSGTFISSNLYVGISGTGTLNIHGGAVSNGIANIGTALGSSGYVTVTGGTWATSGINIGASGIGALTIGGGIVTGSNEYIGNITGSIGTVTVTGGTWANSSTVYVGCSGTGTLNLSGSGVVAIAAGTGTLTIGSNFGSTGTLNIGTDSAAGGVLNASKVAAGSGTATVNFNHTGLYTFTPQLTGNLSVNKLGAGTTILSGSHTFTGSTTVSGGTLEVDGSIASNVTVNNGARLTGCGSIQQALTIDSGGIAQFNASTFTVNGNITNNGLMIVGNGAKIAGSSPTFVNNGTLDLITSGPFTPPAGFQNNGVIIDSSVVKAVCATKSGNTVTITVNSHTGHFYQLQYSPSLAGNSFTNIGAAQAGSTGNTLVFTDTAATGSRGFYRVVVSP